MSRVFRSLRSVTGGLAVLTIALLVPLGASAQTLAAPQFSVVSDSQARDYIRKNRDQLDTLDAAAANWLLMWLFDGTTGDADERAIVTLISELPASTVRALGRSVEEFDDEVDGEEWDELKPILYSKLAGETPAGFTDEIARVVVRNETGRRIVAVQVAHKYSGVYQDTLAWLDLADRETTADAQNVRCRAGGLPADWWFVAWTFADSDEIHYTDPANLRGVFDFLERATLSIVPTATHVAGALCTVASVGLCAPTALAASASVEGLAAGLLSEEGTAGFKKHNLSGADALETTVITLEADGDVNFTSPSGTSVTQSESSTMPELSPADLKQLRALAAQALGTCPVEMRDWMTRHHDALKSRTLLEVTLPGAHDAGSYEKASCRLASGCNTETQSLDIAGQLQCGARYFDLRPLLQNRVLYTGHYNPNSPVGSVGCLGGLMDDVLNDVAAFSAANPQEIIILNFQHAKDLDDQTSDRKSFSAADWQQLQDRVALKLASVLHKNGSADLETATIESILAQGQVIARFQGGRRDTSAGLFKAGDFSLHDHYANTLDVGAMLEDQAAKLGSEIDRNGNDYVPNSEQFVLSWTMTHDTLTAATCSRRIVDRSIKSFADEANDQFASRYLAIVATANEAFEQQANAAISGHNDRQMRGSVEACKIACLSETAFFCRSFDYHKNEGICDLSAATAASVGGLKDDYSGNPYDHYERDLQRTNPILLTDFIDGRSTALALIANGLPLPPNYRFD